MRTITKHAFSGLLALAFTALLVPAALGAQEQAEEAAAQQETCTAQLNPTTVPVGESAIRVTAKLSTSVGEIATVKTGEESAVSLADPADISEKVGMAQEEEQQPRPVQMADEGQNTAIVWLTTADASAGAHPITLEGADGTCSGELTLSEPGEETEGESGGVL